MNQAILLSVKPEWLALILNGKKTIEIRKTTPKCELPIDVYLYCAKEKENYKWVGQKDSEGKVVGKFTLKKVEDLRKYEWARKDDHFYGILKGACLTEQNLQDYCPSKNGETRPLYAWHIPDLVIFDEPKELCDFHPYFPKLERWCHEDSDCDGCPFFISLDEQCKWLKGLTKAPQSWCYVEVEE